MQDFDAKTELRLEALRLAVSSSRAAPGEPDDALARAKCFYAWLSGEGSEFVPATVELVGSGGRVLERRSA